MRLLTAVSLVRVQLGEVNTADEGEPIDNSVYGNFLCTRVPKGRMSAELTGARRAEQGERFPLLDCMAFCIKKVFVVVLPEAGKPYILKT